MKPKSTIRDVTWRERSSNSASIAPAGIVITGLPSSSATDGSTLSGTVISWSTLALSVAVRVNVCPSSTESSATERLRLGIAAGVLLVTARICGGEVSRFPDRSSIAAVAVRTTASPDSTLSARRSTSRREVRNEIDSMAVLCPCTVTVKSPVPGIGVVSSGSVVVEPDLTLLDCRVRENRTGGVRHVAVHFVTRSCRQRLEFEIGGQCGRRVSG